MRILRSVQKVSLFRLFAAATRRRFSVSALALGSRMPENAAHDPIGKNGIYSLLLIFSDGPRARRGKITQKCDRNVEMMAHLSSVHFPQRTSRAEQKALVRGPRCACARCVLYMHVCVFRDISFLSTPCCQCLHLTVQNLRVSTCISPSVGQYYMYK